MGRRVLVTGGSRGIGRAIAMRAAHDGFEPDAAATAGFGPSIGINVHAGRRLTVSLSGHYWYGLQVQGYDSPFEGPKPGVIETMSIFRRTCPRRSSLSEMLDARHLCLAVATLALFAGPAWSGGIGANFTYGRSEGKVDDTGNFFPNINTSANHYEVGLSFDTNLASDRLFNYRINANLQFVNQRLNQRSVKVGLDGAGFARS